jgi:phytanoyl-CoA hydroxylase
VRATAADRRAALERDGYLVIEGLVGADTCAALVARADALIREAPPDVRSVFTTHEQRRRSDAYFLESGEAIRCFLEEGAVAADGELARPLPQAVNKIGHALHDLDPVFAALSRGPALAQLAADLGRADALLIQSMYIFKQPHIGGEVAAHQDHTFLWTDPPSALGFWIALEDATLENACLWVRPGGHREPPRRRFRRDPQAPGGTSFEVLDPRPLEVAGLVPLEVPRGTCVVLDGLLPHASGPNHSSRSRQAYTLHVIDPRAAYRTDNWLQRTTLPLRGF